MSRFRTAVKLTFALLAVWLGLVWAGLLPRPAILPPELDIEPLTFLLGTIAALLFGFWKNDVAKSEAVTGSHRLTEPDESLQTEIRKYLKSRYEHRIRQKLAGREPVNLRKIPSSTGTSDEGAQNFITLPAEKVPSGMAELFDEARGRLLVVGAPGAGKTTLLLQLALALLERPGKDLPVLLNLATWRSEFATFDDWLQRILPLELGASKALAEKIRRNTPLILLLDGLDEVPEDARASCLKAIGEYGAEAKHRFVISSRIAEYAATQDAPVYLEVEVQPLTPQQVIDNLTAYVYTQPEAKPLLNALQTDALLREAVANPFYLNTAQLLFAPGRKYSDFSFTAADVAGRQQELVERFVEDALGRKVKREYSKEKARKWLGFLAGKMEEEKKAVFELVDAQPEWVKSKWLFTYFEFMLDGLLVGLIFWVIFFFLFITNLLQIRIETFVTITLSLLAGLPLIGGFLMLLGFISVYSFLIGIFNLTYTTGNLFVKKEHKRKMLSFRPYRSKIEVVEYQGWSWRIFLLNWKKELPAYLSINLFIGYFLGLTIGMITSHIEIGVIVGIFVGLIIGLTEGINEAGTTKESSLIIANPYQKFNTAWRERQSMIFKQHLALRIALILESSIPLRLVTFLNEMSLRHLLEFDGDPMTGKGGGAWRWRHRIIQEYFLSASAPGSQASAGKKATADKRSEG